MKNLICRIFGHKIFSFEWPIPTLGGHNYKLVFCGRCGTRICGNCKTTRGVEKPDTILLDRTGNCETCRYQKLGGTFETTFI